MLASNPTTFAQVLIGPPGSGKSTYCHGMSQFLSSFGRKVAIVNLDPGNDCLAYEAAIDITELVSVEEVMSKLELGPNGALVYCLNYVLKNMDWLVDRLKELPEHSYVLFDLPGQVEIYTHEDCLHEILSCLQKLDYRMTVVHLVDAHYCTDSSKFISAVLLSLSAMTRLELPHVNVLSKVDLIEKYGALAFNLDFYTEVLDLRHLLEQLEGEEQELEVSIGTKRNHRLKERFAKMNSVLIDVIEDYSLVNFVPLNIEDAETMKRVVAVIDKANGYLFGDLEGTVQASNSIFNSISHDTALQYERVGEIQEKYMTKSDIPIQEQLEACIQEQAAARSDPQSK